MDRLQPDELLGAFRALSMPDGSLGSHAAAREVLAAWASVDLPEGVYPEPGQRLEEHAFWLGVHGVPRPVPMEEEIARMLFRIGACCDCGCPITTIDHARAHAASNGFACEEWGAAVREREAAWAPAALRWEDVL